MDAKYFQVRPTSNPKANGIVVMVKDGKLESLTGGEDWVGPKGIRLNRSDQLTFDPKQYSARSITEKRAKKLQEDYSNWGMLQAWVSSETPTSILSNTPGTREYAHRN